MGDYETAIVNYSYAIQLMLANGYSEDSAAVKEYSSRIPEVQQMQEAGNKKPEQMP